MSQSQIPNKTQDKCQPSKSTGSIQMTNKNINNTGVDKFNKKIDNTEKTTLNLMKSDEISRHLLPSFTSDLRKNQEISILNENNDVEVINFSSDEMLENIQIEDSTVEIVGFLDQIEGPKIVGKAQHYKLLKFIINNNSKHRIQVVAWNKEIERIQSYLQPNGIIHIDGAKAKKPKITEFNNGTLPYELIIRSNTIVNNLGAYNLKTKMNVIQSPIIDFINISEYLNSCIIVHGFIKTGFNTFSNNFKTYGYGSITDGTYKLEIQIINYEQQNYVKGEKIQIKGYVKVANDVFYLNVEEVSDIKLLSSEKMSFNDCLKGTKPIIKRSISATDNEVPNKITRT